jgi:hypothetical protein
LVIVVRTVWQREEREGQDPDRFDAPLAEHSQPAHGIPPSGQIGTVRL